MSETRVCRWTIDDECTCVCTDDDGNVYFEIKTTNGELITNLYLSAEEANSLADGLNMAVERLGDKGSKGAAKRSPSTPSFEELIGAK